MHHDVDLWRHDRADEVVNRFVSSNVLGELRGEILSSRVDSELLVDELFIVADQVEIGVSDGSSSVELVPDVIEGRLRDSFHLNVNVLRHVAAFHCQCWQAGYLVMLC